MKALFAICLCLLATNVCYSQTDTLAYLDKNFEEVPQSKAAYYRVKRVIDANTGKGYQKDFYITGEKLEEINFSKMDSVLDGYSILWFKNGQVQRKMHYVNGRQEGKSETYFEKGGQKWVLNHKQGKLHDTIRTYHANQQLKRLDVYEEGELVKGKCFDETGSEVNHFLFEIMPEFPGGQAAMFKFLSSNMKIPLEMRLSGQEGLIRISFIVANDGKINQIRVINTTHQSLVKNAKKLVKSMPRWQPGVFDGEKVSVKYTLPIRIKLN